MKDTDIGKAAFALIIATIEELNLDEEKLLQKAAEATEKLGKLSGRFGSLKAASVLRDMANNLD